jgi:hypothetical protein
MQQMVQQLVFPRQKYVFLIEIYHQWIDVHGDDGSGWSKASNSDNAE